MVPPPIFRPAAFAHVPNGRVIDTRNDDSPAFLCSFPVLFSCAMPGDNFVESCRRSALSDVRRLMTQDGLNSLTADTAEMQTAASHLFPSANAERPVKD